MRRLTLVSLVVLLGLILSRSALAQPSADALPGNLTSRLVVFEAFLRPT